MKEYNNLLSKIKPGDVILTWGEGIGLFSLPIKIGNYFKKGPKGYADRGWTHAAVYIGKGEIIEAFPKGIEKRDFKEAYLNGHFGLKILRHKNAREEDIKRAIDFYKKEPGSKYDPKALTYFLLANLVPTRLDFLLDDKYLGKWLNVQDSYFCSELVSEGFRVANIYCFEKEPYKIMPIQFDNELLFDIVDQIYLPRKENTIVYKIKVFFFNIFYFLTISLLPIVFIFIMCLIIAVAIAFSVGIIFILKRKK